MIRVVGDDIAAAAVFVSTVISVYLLFAFFTALGNSTALNDACVKAGNHWQANPWTLGATGECVNESYQNK